MAFTNEDILVLAKAGFNASQIAALNTVNAAPATPVDPLSQILAQLQQNAINASQQPKVQTADEILAEIINPTIKEG